MIIPGRIRVSSCAVCSCIEQLTILLNSLFKDNFGAVNEFAGSVGSGMRALATPSPLSCAARSSRRPQLGHSHPRRTSSAGPPLLPPLFAVAWGVLPDGTFAQSTPSKRHTEGGRCHGAQAQPGDCAGSIQVLGVAPRWRQRRASRCRCTPWTALDTNDPGRKWRKWRWPGLCTYTGHSSQSCSPSEVRVSVNEDLMVIGVIGQRFRLHKPHCTFAAHTTRHTHEPQLPTAHLFCAPPPPGPSKGPTGAS